MTYPQKHKDIVTSLMDGKFITVDDLFFQIVRKNEEFYIDFFQKSFEFELVGNQDFYYLVSHETNEKTSRDIAIFFAVLCYELDKNGKNFLDELEFAVFPLNDIIKYFAESSWRDVIEANKQLANPDSIKKLINNTLIRRNIAKKEGNDLYSFTKASKLFLDFLKDLIKDENH